MKKSVLLQFFSKMSGFEMSNVIHDQDGEDLRQKIKRQAKAKQTEALADSLVETVRAQDVKALVSVRKGKLNNLEVAELLVGRTSLKEWRKMTKLVRMEKIVKRRLSTASVDKMEEDQKEKIIVKVSTEKLPEVNFQNY